jgi:protein O-mannosyl-transferase
MSKKKQITTPSKPNNTNTENSAVLKTETAAATANDFATSEFAIGGTNLPLMAIVMAILAVTFLVFSNTLSADFVNWDDMGYLWENKLVNPLSSISFADIFTGSTCGNYSPLVVLSYCIEHSFDTIVSDVRSGENFNPFIYHLTNVLFHLGTTGLVFVFLRQLGLKSWGLVIATLLFGIHPMRVESVAWVTERKDVMYGFFFVASCIAYWKYITVEGKKGLHYTLALVLGLCAMLSKIQAVSLPLAFFALDYWANRPLFLAKNEKSELNITMFLEKIPYFALSLIIGIVGIKYVGAAGGFEDTGYALWQRLLFAPYSIVMYLQRFVAPYGLSTFYPYPKKIDGVPQMGAVYYIMPFVVAGLAYFIYTTTKKTRLIAFGALFFILNIFMLLQIQGAGKAFVADRFTYIPYIGLFFLVGMAYNAIVEGRFLGGLRSVVPFIMLGFLGLMGILTFLQNKTWDNSVALWENVNKFYPDEPLPFSNKGLAYNDKVRNKGLRGGKKVDANATYDPNPDYNNSIKAYDEAIAVDKYYHEAHYNKGVALFNTKRYKEALVSYTNSINIKPEQADGYYSRGLAYANVNDGAAALKDFEKAQQLGYKGKPDEMYNAMGSSAASAGQHPQAIEYYKKAIAVRNAPEYHYMIGNSLAPQNKMAEAIVEYDAAIALKPDYVAAINNKGNALASMGRVKDALPFFDKAIQLKPDAPDYYANRGIARNSNGDRQGACADWQKALQMGYAQAQALIQANCK